MSEYGPEGRLFSDLEDDRMSNNLGRLWQIGIVNAQWDEEEECTRWCLSEMAEEMYETGGKDSVERFIREMNHSDPNQEPTAVQMLQSNSSEDS